MVDQVKITRMADTVDTMVKAVMTSGMMNSSRTPQQHQKGREGQADERDTVFFDSRLKIPGALPRSARPNNMRLDEKTPLLADDAAEVSTTKFTIPAAAGKTRDQEQFDKRTFCWATPAAMRSPR